MATIIVMWHGRSVELTGHYLNSVLERRTIVLVRRRKPTIGSFLVWASAGFLVFALPVDIGPSYLEIPLLTSLSITVLLAIPAGISLALDFTLVFKMSPVPHALPDGVVAQRWLTADGNTEDDWPDWFETEVGDRSIVATLTVEFENSGSVPVEFPLIVYVSEKGDIAGPGEDDLLLAIRQR